MEHPTSRLISTTLTFRAPIRIRRPEDADSGGGIKTDAKAGDDAQQAPAFNSIHDNQVVGTVNYGIQFAAGHHNVAANNRVTRAVCWPMEAKSQRNG